MPRLLIFAPCDNVLVSGSAQSVSLIIVLAELNYPWTPPPTLKVGDAVSMRWFAFTQWELRPEETGKNYIQRISLSSSEGTEYLSFEMTLTPEAGKLVHRAVAGHTVLPFLLPGMYRFKVLIREEGSTQEWTEAGDYPINVAHNPGEGLSGFIIPQNP